MVGSEDSITEAEDVAQERLFDWKDDSISGMIAMFQAAQRHASYADSEKAELLFLKALKGYGVLLGPTHEDTTKAAFAVANFYTEQGQLKDADMVVEDLCQRHIKEFDFKHPLTQRVIQQVADLLNDCNRPDDALAFLSRSIELAGADAEEAFRKPNKRSKTRRQGIISQRHAATPYAKLLKAAEEITAGSDPDLAEYGIQLARRHVAAKDEAVEAFLKVIIDHCEHHGEVLEIQNLRARCELLKFYSKLGQIDSHKFVFFDAISTAEVIIDRRRWERERFKSFKTMEALVVLVTSVLNAGFDFQALSLFIKIGQKAGNDFGWDDGLTIWAEISIGIIYQRCRGWESAMLWFELARITSFTAWGEEDSITRSLSAAIETRHFSGPHFSYVPNEDTRRPFEFLFEV